MMQTFHSYMSYNSFILLHCNINNLLKFGTRGINFWNSLRATQAWHVAVVGKQCCNFMRKCDLWDLALNENSGGGARIKSREQSPTESRQILRRHSLEPHPNSSQITIVRWFKHLRESSQDIIVFLLRLGNVYNPTFHFAFPRVGGRGSLVAQRFNPCSRATMVWVQSRNELREAC